MSGSLQRRLSVVGLWLLIINGMIGAGIFGVPADAARLAGALSPWLFAIGALLLCPIFLCFAQLGSYFTSTGGPVQYAGAAFGPFAGFQVGWCLYVARLLAFAANANLLVGALGRLIAHDITPASRMAILLPSCAILAVINVMGVRGAMRWLGSLTALKFLPLLLLVGFGLPTLLRYPNAGAQPAATDIGTALLLVIYAYTGFETAGVVSGEAINPKRDLPRALLGALGACTLVYVSIQAVSVAALPSLSASSVPLVDVANVLMGPWGGLLLAAGTVASVVANMSGSMFALPRITYQLGVDGHLPRWFSVIHPTTETPVWSIVFYAGAGFVLAAWGGFAVLAGLSVATRLLLYVVCIAAMPRLHKMYAAAAGSMHLPGGWTIPALGLIVSFGLMLQVRPAAYLYVAGLLLVGSALLLAGKTRLLRQHVKPQR